MSPQIFPASRRWKNLAPVWHYLDWHEFPNSSCTYFSVWSKLTAQVSNQLFFTIFQFTEKFTPVCNHTRWCRIQISASVAFALDWDSRSSVWTAFPSKFFKIPLKNLPQCVVKFNHETLLGCFLTFPVFSVLTTCFWSLAHPVGLFDDMLLIIWSDDTFSIFDPSSQAFDSFNTFLMVVALPWSLVCLLIFPLTEKLPQCGVMPSNFSSLRIDRKNCPGVVQ